MTYTLIDPDDDADESTEDAEKRSGEADDEILADARKKYKACQDAEGENRINAIADLNFLAGGENQWDPIAVSARKLDGRPIITVNSLPTYLHQVTNDQRMNTPAIKVHAVSEGADQETAKTRQGLIRHIEYDSNADVAYDTAVNSAAAVGFGYFRLVTDYESPASFDQKIMFQRIRNAMSVKIDPLSVEPDGSDQKYAFVELKMDKGSFKRDWPKAKAGGDTAIFNGDSSYSDWLTDTEVLVCDFYRIETTAAEVVMLSTGESGFADELIPPGGEKTLPVRVTVVKRRPGERSKTMLYKITGCDILERTEIMCKWIPVFPVYGDEIDIEGKIIRSGIIRNAKGPAQMYNVMMTSATEEVSLRAKSPYIGAEGQFEGYEDQWAQANVRAFPYLEYKPVTLDGSLAPAPQRNPMADVPQGMLAMAMHASDNIKKTTGLFDASLGAKGTATSGVQERAQQKEGDVANFHYSDGLNRTIVHVGRCIDWMLPYYYDSPDRNVAILGEDETMSHVKINTTDPKTGNPVNDMRSGKYAVTMSAGPSFSTARQESAEFFGNALSVAKDPASAAVFSYLAIRNQDIPGGEVATKMMETLLPAPAKAVLAEENGEQEEGEVIQTSQGPIPTAQIPQLLDEMQQKNAQLQETLQKTNAAKVQTDAMKQQHIMLEQQLEPQRLHIEQERIAADREKTAAARLSAEADLLRAQAEAQAIPAKAHAEAMAAETAHMTAQVEALHRDQQLQIDAALAEAQALHGDTTAFDAWKESLHSRTQIEVAHIMAGSREKVAAMKPQPKGNTK